MFIISVEYSIFISHILLIPNVMIMLSIQTYSFINLPTVQIYSIFILHLIV